MTTMTQTHTLGRTLPDPSGDPPTPPGRGNDGGGPGSGGGGGSRGGGGGRPPQFRAFITPPQGGHHDDKFKGNPLMPFNGNRELVCPFLTQWEIYKGEEVFEWVQSQTEWLMTQLQQGASTRGKYLYDTVLDAFTEAFTDTMSVQKAKRDIQTI
ncbi:hypothetical protein EDB83DRAFT_2323012 [Lactarius deliciosus]|nr:hypothetical protein EDB83DRAFT_2323012 [Lactarius deliciosus]